MTQQRGVEVGATKKQTNWKLIVGALIVFGLFAPNIARLIVGPPDPRLVAEKAAREAEAAANATRERAACSVRKADGSPGDRDCDLVELCKDASFQNRKLAEYNSTGDAAKSIAAGADLRQTLAWMAEYRHEDVAAVCGGTYGAPAANPVVTSSKPAISTADGGPMIARCAVAPNEIFRIGAASSEAELNAALEQKCPGAKLQDDGRVVVAWSGREYLVETVKHGEPASRQYEIIGVWLK